MPRPDRDQISGNFHASRDYPNTRQKRAAVPDDVVVAGPAVKGYIKRLTRDKGFGFIRDDAGAEYFFHRSETNGAFDDLAEGDRVSFQPMRSSKGPRAHDVQLTTAD